MKALFIFGFVFSFMFLSCTELDNPQTKIEFSYKYHEKLDFGEYHIYDIPFRYSQTIDSNQCLITKEVEGREAVLYQLNLDVDYFKLTNNSNKSDTIKLIPFKKNTYKLDKDYVVYKFAKTPLVIDGCTTYFWTEEFGVFLYRSTTWGNFGKLTSNNPNLNKRVNLLCEIMYQDSHFYKGCISENICVPKHLYQEFDAWYSTKYNRVPSLEVE